MSDLIFDIPFFKISFIFTQRVKMWGNMLVCHGDKLEDDAVLSVKGV